MTQASDCTYFIVVGDVMVDTFARSHDRITMGTDHAATISRHVGGQAANTSSWLAWLGMPVTLIASCGDDTDGQWVSHELNSLGVQPNLTVVDRPTGVCSVIVDIDGARTMFSDPGANLVIDHLSSDAWSELVAATRERSHVHASGYLLERDDAIMASLLKSARTRNPSLTASVDTAALNPTDSHRRSLLGALPYLDVLMGTIEELASFAGFPEANAQGHETALIDHWRTSHAFAGTIVIKRGADGALADNGDEQVTIGAQPTHVADTTGAGDAFCAGFLAAWTLDQSDLATALESGTTTASTAISRVGAGPGPREGR